MPMTIDALIRVLEELKQVTGGDAEVRIAAQPNYPLEASIYGVSTNEESEDGIVYICEGSRIGYASAELWFNAIQG